MRGPHGAVAGGSGAQPPSTVEKVTKRHGRQVLCHKDDRDYIRTEEELAAV